MRSTNRLNHQCRPISIKPHYSSHADGSCLISYGHTQVLCTATIEETIPAFLKGHNTGWITAEYGMLPTSCAPRKKREVMTGKQDGRTIEIQRLIGRSLRASVDRKKLGERQITVDCDVLHADGGTRTAAITGGYVAMYLALLKLQRQKKIDTLPITSHIAAISCGICDNQILVDLDYAEDKHAQVDANFVLTQQGKIIEIQSSAEKEPFLEKQLITMLALARKTIQEIILIQKEILA